MLILLGKLSFVFIYSFRYDILHTGGSKSSDCKDEIMRTFIGNSVITNYNQKQTYVVDDIDFVYSPRKTFTKGGQEVIMMTSVENKWNT